MPTPEQSAPTTARALARRELTRAIVEEARRQLASVGPAQLSVRAVARELGMASSAVYRYFATRDELLTALILIGYDELGEVVETAEAAVPRDALLGRWLAITGAFRGWAQEHPHDYALLYGSPVPGYAAPSDTIEPAARVIRLVLTLVADAVATRPRTDTWNLSTGERMWSEAVRPVQEYAGPEFTDEMTYRALVAWGGVIGALTLELFGHLHNAIADYDAWFEHSMFRLVPF